MIHRWNHVPSYGVEETYKIGMEWLADCALVEDWGCGPQRAKHFRQGAYRGIDGYDADVCADLNSYRSSVEGIFMRHVLEHNVDWRSVLANALASFTKRMALIMFTPESPVDVLPNPRKKKIPTLRVCWPDLRNAIAPFLVEEHKVPWVADNVDTVFLLEKRS